MCVCVRERERERERQRERERDRERERERERDRERERQRERETETDRDRDRQRYRDRDRLRQSEGGEGGRKREGGREGGGIKLQVEGETDLADESPSLRVLTSSELGSSSAQTSNARIETKNMLFSAEPESRRRRLAEKARITELAPLCTHAAFEMTYVIELLVNESAFPSQLWLSGTETAQLK